MPFPKNYSLAEGVTLKKLLSRGEGWQIYLLNNEAKAMIVSAELYEFWVNLKLVQSSHFTHFLFNNTLYYFFYSDEEYELTDISKVHDFVSVDEGLSYAIALRETRKIIPEVSLKNGIFAERISRILPMRDEINSVPDDIILGTWLTGGLSVSATSAERMLQVQPCLTDDELSKIVTAAGLEISEKGQSTAINPEKQALNPPQKNKQPFSLPGRKDLENFLVDNVIDIIENPEAYEAMNISFPGAFILQGPPGCGKTYAVEQLVAYLNWPVFYVESGTIGSPYIHETGKKISALFKEAMDNAPSIFVIDEMESFLSTRSQSADSNGHHKEEMAEFLRRIPEAAKNKVLIIGMTNMINLIDPAIRRRGRFDHIIEVGMPSTEEIQQVIDSLLQSLPHDENIDTKKLAEVLDGAPMSDVSFIIREAARLTAKNHLSSISQEIISSTVEKVHLSHKVNKRSIGFLNEQ